MMQSYNNLANGNMICPNSLIKLITQLSYLKLNLLATDRRVSVSLIPCIESSLRSSSVVESLLRCGAGETPALLLKYEFQRVIL